jgi:hypothetical protein
MLNPRQQVITKTDLAKFENSWRQLPHIVSHGAQKNFLAFSSYTADEWDRNSNQFNDDYFKRAVGKALLFRTTEKIVSEQPWYHGGYRANIVTYAVSKLINMIENQTLTQVLDPRMLWSQQVVPPDLSAVIAVIAKAVFDVIVSPDSAVQNVTEWCKKELCWTRVVESEISLDVGKKLRSILIDRRNELEIQRSSRKEQRIDDGIENQRLVLSLGATYWTSARKWAREQAITSPEEDGILAVAASMPKRIPSEKQSWRLIQIKDKLELEGFPKAELQQDL